LPVAQPADPNTSEARAVTVDLGRGSLVAVAIGVPLYALSCGAALYAAFDTDQTAVTVIGGFFAVVFGLPLLVMLLNLRKLLAPRGLVFDARGVRYWQGASSCLLPWEAVAAVGIGYEQPPSLPSLSLQDLLKDRIVDALVDPRRRIAVEIFPVDPGTVELQPALRRYRREGQAPAEGLPRLRWRLPLPPYSGLVARVTEGVQSFQPQRWLGWFARPWGEPARRS